MKAEVVQNDRRTYRITYALHASVSRQPREPENTPLAGGRSPDRRRWNPANGKLVRRVYGGPPVRYCHSQMSQLGILQRYAIEIPGEIGMTEANDRNPSMLRIKNDCDVGLLLGELSSARWTTTWKVDMKIHDDRCCTMGHRRLRSYAELGEICRN